LGGEGEQPHYDPRWSVDCRVSCCAKARRRKPRASGAKNITGQGSGHFRRGTFRLGEMKVLKIAISRIFSRCGPWPIWMSNHGLKLESTGSRRLNLLSITAAAIRARQVGDWEAFNVRVKAAKNAPDLHLRRRFPRPETFHKRARASCGRLASREERFASHVHPQGRWKTEAGWH